MFSKTKSSLLVNELHITDALKEKYGLPSHVIDAKHIEELLEYQSTFDLKLEYKLTPEQLHENHFDK